MEIWSQIITQHRLLRNSDMKRPNQGFSTAEKRQKRTKESPESKHIVAETESIMPVWVRRPESDYSLLDHNGRVVEEPQLNLIRGLSINPQPGKFLKAPLFAVFHSVRLSAQKGNWTSHTKVLKKLLTTIMMEWTTTDRASDPLAFYRGVNTCTNRYAFANVFRPVLHREICVQVNNGGRDLTALRNLEQALDNEVITRIYSVKYSGN